MNQDKDRIRDKNDSKLDGWKSLTETGRREGRSIDNGESGQFAPGGYYNQHRVNEPRRTLIDDDIVPPGRNTRSR
jgi:hypothetical protein